MNPKTVGSGAQNAKFQTILRETAGFRTKRSIMKPNSQKNHMMSIYYTLAQIAKRTPSQYGT